MIRKLKHYCEDKISTATFASEACKHVDDLRTY